MPSATLHAVPAASLPVDAPNVALADDAHEAARYAVLRRLGSAIRHQIAGALQPVSMMASMVERRIQKESPDLDVLRRNCAEMSVLARSASGESVALLAWLVPSQDEPIAVGQGIDECLHLLGTELSLRGFSVSHDTGEHHALVARSRLRSLFPAVLLALTDTASGPAQVDVRCLESQGLVTIQMSATAVDDAPPPMAAKGYRPITWRDVRAMATADGVDCHLEAGSVQFVLPVIERQPRVDAGRRWG